MHDWIAALRNNAYEKTMAVDVSSMPVFRRRNHHGQHRKHNVKRSPFDGGGGHYQYADYLLQCVVFCHARKCVIVYQIKRFARPLHRPYDLNCDLPAKLPRFGVCSATVCVDPLSALLVTNTRHTSF